MTQKISFLEELLEKGCIDEHVSSISLKNSSNKIHHSTVEPKFWASQDTLIYTDVPGYMRVSFFGQETNKNEKSVATFEGSYIDLGRYTDIDQFLKAKLSSKRISRLKAYKRNLERVFPITYNYYYGNIDDTTYGQLMDSLKSMITKRFHEKELEHLALMEWDKFKENGRKLIQEKKAAIIVIQHGDHPIHISFNYVWEKLVFGYVRGFDVDYSKFYLGYIDILLQLDWCFKNQFKIYDLLRENMEYKLRFADCTYLYRTHIVYPQKPVYKKVASLKQWLSISLEFDVYYPVIDKLKGIYRKIPFLPKRRRQIKSLYYLDEVSGEERSKLEQGTYQTVNLYSNPQIYLKRAAYHFLYLSKDNLENLKVYRDPVTPNIFYLKGLKTMKKVHFNQSETRNGDLES